MFISKNDLEVREENDRLQRQIENLERVQANSLRVAFNLPPAIAEMVDLKDLSEGLISSDGQGMTYVLSSTVILLVEPFSERLTLSDPQGIHQPLVISLKGDFTTGNVLLVNGYVTLVQRSGVGQTATDWATTLDTAVLGAPA